MGREFDAYNENFVGDRPNADGRYEWLVRVYSYAPKPGLITTKHGTAGTHDQARADAVAAARAELEKHRRAP